MAKIVVLGANGFIGRHLVARLATAGQKDTIIAFDRFSDFKTGKPHIFEKYTNVSLLPGDFSIRDDVREAIDGADYVFHLISTTNPALSLNDPFVDLDTNVRYSLEVMQACVDAKVKKLIFLSSGGTIYGDIDSSFIHEEATPNPKSPYGIGKLTIEHYLRYFEYHHGLEYIIYRVANPYGPGQNIYGKQGVIPIFLHSFLHKEPVNIYGDGTMVRDYIYIDDLIGMIVGSYREDNRHMIYNIGSGKGASINEIVVAIEKHVGEAIKKIYVDTPSIFIQKSVLNISRFTDEFSARPHITLEEGIGKTWDYVKQLG